MSLTVADAQEFLAWCRSQKIQTVELDGLKATFSPAAFYEPRLDEKPAKKPEIDPRTGYTDEELYGST
jgi:hypothetical protein